MKTRDNTVERRKSQLRAEIEKLGRGGFSKVASDLNVSKGALWKFLNTDYIPTSKAILRKLGLPEPTIIFQKRNKEGQYESF